MSSIKVSKRNNKSVEILKTRNINSKGTLNWPTNLSWTEDSEILFKTHIKNDMKNKNINQKYIDKIIRISDFF